MALSLLQDEFILPPSFTLSPQSLPLGTLLPRLPRRKLPDPRSPLNDTPDAVPSATTATILLPTFNFSHSVSSGSGASLLSSVPLFSPVNGSLNLDRSSSHRLTIEALGERGVERRTYDPTPEEILGVLREGGKFIVDYSRKSFRPSIFLVTGVMVVKSGAKIKILKGRKREGGGEVGVDLTAVGAPVEVGVGGHGHRHWEVEREWEQEGEFVVSYRVLRLRLRRDGTLKAKEEFNKFALMDDQVFKDEGEELEGRWVCEKVTGESLEGMSDESEEISEEED